MTIGFAPLALLFDADGVLQQPSPNWQARLVGLAGAQARSADFLAEVFAAEAPCLTGHADFERALCEVLARWDAPCSLQDALAIWTQLEPNVDALALVDSLRARGLPCYLTTNQHALRARHMSSTLGYAKRFDREFYSCELGHAKPALSYFRAVLDAIVLPPSRVLFIDDHPRNVEAARSAGLQAATFDIAEGADMLAGCIESFGVILR